MDCPSYYRLADGQEFETWFAENCLPELVAAGINHRVVHAVTSACEHRFRLGRKTSDKTHDEKAIAYWLGLALKCTKDYLPVIRETHFAVIQSVYRRVAEENEKAR